MNIAQTVRVFKALMQGPVSRIDLAKHIDATPKTIGKLLAEMKAQKLIRVIDYVNHNDGRNKVKVYTIGEGEDVLPKSAQPQRIRSRKKYLKSVVVQAHKPASTFVGGKSLWS